MWYDMLELHKQVESGYGSENSLNRHGSLMSLSSTTSLSTASTSSFKRGRGLKEKLAEMETFRDILCHQVDTLQSYFNACSAAVANHESVHDMVNDDIDDLNDVDSEKSGQQSNHVYSLLDSNSRDNEMINILRQHGAHAIDFKGESFTFKATTAGILATLSHCIELMGQREDAWRKRLEREVERRKRYEDAYRVLLSERPKPIILGGPDYEEGPHSVIHEEEFFDAVDATLDKLEKEEEKKLSFKKEKILKPPLTSMEPSHPLYNEINSVVSDHLAYSDVTVTDLPAEWVLIADEGEMKVYRMELEEDGIVVDPTKAVHTVRGITGHEMCYNFWDSTVRMEWEGTLESTELLEWLSKDTVISHQIHKRVWPSTQRDSLFWSTIRHFPSDNDEGPDCWIVVNHDTPHNDVPLNTKFVRMRFNIAMICQTVVQPPDNGEEIKRENLSCRIQYSANVNPGGWAPASVVRMISKRELPKFLKTFTTYVQEKVKDQPIMF
ncbi:hypothetical protein NP493_1079g00032 [Ridgeia piscesae]|uniref:START domain-containing protein n=1 Tax=Ridgeia piscesae TaxID=27915 RepID=A0AAD9KHI9_RIDPI|nr:hypothetical protein NP493_1079g00032 [Ridgeia piscesae]